MAFEVFSEPSLVLLVLLGTAFGITVGAIPGLTGAMLISLSLPLTFGMDGQSALALLVAMYVGSVSGGLITATLLRMPGTPASIITTLDGYPMAQSGRAGRGPGIGDRRIVHRWGSVVDRARASGEANRGAVDRARTVGIFSTGAHVACAGSRRERQLAAPRRALLPVGNPLRLTWHRARERRTAPHIWLQRDGRRLQAAARSHRPVRSEPRLCNASEERFGARYG